ncbi:hypothetical protein [Natronomonas aquatica]|jgi:hypothetical protein|nr:hypothetical protein [Natronomonas aquatica]
MARAANPAFAVAVVFLPLAVFGYVQTAGTTTQHTFVHVMAGVLWTGIDIFMGLVVGPVIGGLDEESASEFFRRFTPKSAFLLPTIAVVAIFSGITLAIRTELLPSPDAWLALFTLVNLPGALLLIGWQFDAWRDPRWVAPFAVSLLGSAAWVAVTVGGLRIPGPAILAALVIVTVLNLEGFGLILPGEIRVYREMNAAEPDAGLIQRIGQRNAKLAGVQGTFQFLIVVVMVYLRYGEFPFL